MFTSTQHDRKTLHQIWPFTLNCNNIRRQIAFLFSIARCWIEAKWISHQWFMNYTCAFFIENACLHSPAVLIGRLIRPYIEKKQPSVFSHKQAYIKYTLILLQSSLSHLRCVYYESIIKRKTPSSAYGLSREDRHLDDSDCDLVRLVNTAHVFGAECVTRATDKLAENLFFYSRPH